MNQGFCVVELLFDDAQRPVDYRFVEINTVFTEQTGLTNALGCTARELIPDLEQYWFDTYGRVALTGEPARFVNHAAPMGRWFEVNAFRIGPAQERQVAVLFTDITARREAEEALRQSEERFRAIVTQATVGIAEARHGRFIYVNDRYCQITGFGREQLLGRLVGDITHPDDAARDMALIQRLYETGEPFVVDKRYIRPDGTLVWTLNSVTPIRDADGRISRSLAACIDVTGRKRAEEALRRSEERLQKTLSIETVGVIFFDLEGRIHGANEAFERMSGYSREDFVSGRVRWDEVTPPEFMAVTDRSKHELLTLGQNTPYEKQYIRPDGSRWWGLFSGKRLNDGECVEFVLDISRRKQAEQDLRKSNEQLTRTNVDLDNFIYTASHDLKAPIANIEGLLSALHTQLSEESSVSETVGTMLHLMEHSVERFKRTIGHLTDITKLQKEHEQPAAVPLGPVVNDVLQDLQPLVQQLGAHVEVDLDSCRAVLLTPKNLRSVVYNLLSNALKYRHPDRPPHVQLRCRLETSYTVLSVQDNGLGLAPERQTELFGMFRRFHSHVEGSGIGLYMVKRIVENMGGHIEVSSQPGEGSTFSVYFRR